MSLTPIRRALLSAITLFGGHFQNRRLDRVVLIGTLLALAVMISIGLPVALFQIRGPDSRLALWTLSVLSILVGTIALFSAGLTFLDARHPPGPSTTTLRLTRLPLTMFGVLVVAALLLLAGMRASELRAHTEFAAPIVGRIEFGKSPEIPFTFHSDPLPPPAPPSGLERLRGRITLDGTGIKGAKVTLSLNSQYRVALDSDAGGEFEARLPAGQWHLNDLAVSDWLGRPTDRELLLFSGHEPKKSGGQYSRFNYRLANGLPVSLPVASSAPFIELEFRDAIQITWPPHATTPPDTEFSTAAISWLSVAGASEYEVQIESVTTGIPLLTRHLAGLTLPLATLPQRTPTALADTYAVHIFAFDSDGRLLTQSNTRFTSRTFTLSGAIRLGKEQQYVGFDGPSKVISAEYELNQNRLEVARRLLNQNRFDDVRRMLDQVTNDAPYGEASALRGKLAALQGDCATANELFDRAKAERGCVSEEDRRLCEAAKK